MTKTKRRILIILLPLLLIALCCGIYNFMIYHADYGFCRSVDDAERQLRLQMVSDATRWLGADEGSDGHTEILTIYNTHQPLAQGYEVQPEDNWCATFVSAVAIECGMTDVIPTECGCQRQIGLFEEAGCWVEDDSYEPLPGDIIYYCNSDRSLTGDCTGWSDHVGIVVGTWGGYIKVIEGNYADSVGYRYIRIDAPTIRGFAVPNY